MGSHTTPAGRIRIGTSGWNYSHWRGRFYPADLSAKHWFEYYQGHFDTVEINNTFYNLPAPSVFESWKKQASEHFVYAVKANRYLTHLKKLKATGESLTRFLDRARMLGPHLGPILYQLPPHWNPDLSRVREFCRALPDDLIHVMEFRERTWLTGETFGLLEEFDVCLCIHDLLDRHPRRVTGPAAYIRFHGAGNRYGGSYPRAQLRRWSSWIEAAAADGFDVFAYFNNDAEGHAVRNAATLRELVCAPGSALYR